MARRTRRQIDADKREFQIALALAMEVKDEHADHPHYHGHCFYETDNEGGQPLVGIQYPKHSVAYHLAREHRLARFLVLYAYRIEKALGPSS